MSWSNGYVADIQYLSGFFAEQSPAQLNFSCVLNGIEPVPIDQDFTYFELGFGQGLTANILAASNPRGRFYAADFNPAQVVAAQQLADAAQLDNLVLLENGVAELAAGEVDLPQFDFITMHGVYSWVNAETRGHIVKFLARYLKPGGIVYVSYNAMPGWASALPLQRLLLEHRMYPGGTDRQLQEAQRLIIALDQVQAGYLTENTDQVLKDRRDSIMKHKLGYLAHEYMNRGWDALYHVDVARQLADAKLDYACSTSPYDVFPHLCFTQEQQTLLSEAVDAGMRETCKDYIRNTAFRRDIFVRGARRMTPKRRMEWLRQFGLASIILRENRETELDLPVGQTTDAGLYGAVLDVLEQGPKSLAELAELPQFAETDMAGVTEVAAMLISSSQAAPWFLHAVHTEPGPAQRLNRVLAELTCGGDYHRALASPLLGSGMFASRIQRLVYRALDGQADGIDAETVAEEVWQIWQLLDEQQAAGHLGSGSTEPEQTSHGEVVWAVKNVLKQRLPIWHALHMR